MLYYSDTDKRNEESVKQRLEAAWDSSVHFFGNTNQIDAYVARGGEIRAWLEVKCRKVTKNTYDTIYLAFRKWLNLITAELHTERPGLFVVDFSDQLCYIPIRSVDARNIKLLGRTDRVGAANDLEPIIEVPIASFIDIKN